MPRKQKPDRFVRMVNRLYSVRMNDMVWPSHAMKLLRREHRRAVRMVRITSNQDVADMLKDTFTHDDAAFVNGYRTACRAILAKLKERAK